MTFALILLGFVCLLAPWLARLGGYEVGRKPFDLVGVGGIFFLLTAAFTMGSSLVYFLSDASLVLAMISFLLAVAALVAGAVWETVQVMRMPDHVEAQNNS